MTSIDEKHTPTGAGQPRAVRSGGWSVHPRNGMLQNISRRDFLVYLITIALVTLPFFFQDVRDITGLRLEFMLLVVGYHILGNTYYYLRGPYATYWYENAFIFAALPFFSAPYQPIIWILYILSALNDAVITLPNRLYAAVLFLLPWLAWGLQKVLLADPRMDAASIAAVSVFSLGAYLWVGRILDAYEDIREQNAALHEQAVKGPEFKRVAGNLEVWLGGNLSGLARRSQRARETLHTQPDRVGAMLAEMEQLARTTLQQVRVAMRSLVRHGDNEDTLALLRGLARDVAPERIVVTTDPSVASTQHNRTPPTEVLLFWVELLQAAGPTAAEESIQVHVSAVDDQWVLAITGPAAADDLLGRMEELEARAQEFGLGFLAVPRQAGGVSIALSTSPGTMEPQPA